MDRVWVTLLLVVTSLHSLVIYVKSDTISAAPWQLMCAHLPMQLITTITIEDQVARCHMLRITKAWDYNFT